MASGLGRAHKPYTVNTAKESTFKNEGSTYEALSGPINEQPSLKLASEKLTVPKQDELGVNHKIKKGGSAHEYGFKYPIENWKGIGKMWGGIIDRPYILIADVDVSGDYSGGDTLTGVTSGAKALIDSVSTTLITLKMFAKDDTIKGNSSSGLGTLERIEDQFMYIKSASAIFTPAGEDIYVGANFGAATVIATIAYAALTYKLSDRSTIRFQDGEQVTGTSNTALIKVVDDIAFLYNFSGAIASGETITGGTTGATATVATGSTTYVMLVLKQFGETEDVTDAVDVNTLTDIIYSHFLFVYRCQSAYSFVYNYESLDKQHNLTGGVMTDLTLSGAGNEVPSIQENYLVAKHVSDVTKDDGIVNEVTELYLFENLAIVINSIDYGSLIKTREFGFKREITKLFTNTLTPVGMAGPSLESTVKLGIHRQDYAFYDLRISDTTFAVVVTFTRGVNDTFTLTYATCKALEATEEENDKTVFIPLTVDVEGTPTAVAVDRIRNYG